MKAILCSLGMFVTSIFAQAPIEHPVVNTLSNKTYRAVKVRSMDSEQIKIIHQDGMATLKVSDLSKETLQELGFDPGKVTAHVEPVKPAYVPKPRATAKAAKLTYQPISVIVDSKVGDGYLCYRHTSGGVASPLARALGNSTYVRPTTNYQKPLFVTGIKGDVAIGQVLTGDAALAGVREVNGQPYEHWISKP